MIVHQESLMIFSFTHFVWLRFRFCIAIVAAVVVITTFVTAQFSSAQETVQSSGTVVVGSFGSWC
jgi:cytochrome c oxidase subunit IV